MVSVTGGPPVDNTAYHRYCRYHDTGYWQLFKGSDSVADSAGISQIRSEIDKVDTKLKAAETAGATPAPDCYTGLWRGSTSQSLSSTSTLANPTFTWTTGFELSGTPTISSFNTTNGQFSLGTDGYWRITYCADITGASAVTEGYVNIVLKDASLGAYPVRSLTTMPLETYLGETTVFKSVLYRVGTTGNCDLDPSKTYVLAAVQENNLGSALTYGTADTWLSIEYVRPL